MKPGLILLHDVRASARWKPVLAAWSTGAPMKILVVEDNPKHASFLSRALAAQGYEAELSGAGADAIRLATRKTYDLVLLDWNLPGLDGLAVCRLLRQSGRTVPIVMLTVRAERDDHVKALEAGADDYVTKPYDMDVLLARIRALTRRAGLDHEDVIEAGSIVVRTREHAAYVDGVKLELTAREFALLCHLARRAGSVVGRDELLTRVWGVNTDPESNVVDVHVAHLRAKLGVRARKQLQTVRGVGFILNVSRVSTRPPMRTR
jgi:DNA-binding response OmpR family regulator